MAVTKSDVFTNDTTGMENKTVIVTTILVNIIIYYFIATVIVHYSFSFGIQAFDQKDTRPIISLYMAFPSCVLIELSTWCKTLVFEAVF